MAIVCGMGDNAIQREIVVNSMSDPDIIVSDNSFVVSMRTTPPSDSPATHSYGFAS